MNRKVLSGFLVSGYDHGWVDGWMLVIMDYVMHSGDFVVSMDGLLTREFMICALSAGCNSRKNGTGPLRQIFYLAMVVVVEISFPY